MNNSELQNLNNLYNNYIIQCNQLAQSSQLDDDAVKKIVEIENIASKIFKAQENQNLYTIDYNNLKTKWKFIENRCNRILFKFHKRLSFEEHNQEISVSIRDATSTQYQSQTHIEKKRTVFNSILSSLIPSFIKNAIIKKITYSIFWAYKKKIELDNDYIALEKLKKKSVVIGGKIQQASLLQYLNLKNKLQSDLNEIDNQIAQTEEKIHKAELLEDKGAATRSNFEKIGGESVELTTADQVKLDATFLDCSKFKQVLKSNGAKLAQISYTLPNGNTQLIEAIWFENHDFENNKTSILETLRDLKTYIQPTTDPNEAGGSAGWCKVMDEDKIFLVRYEYLLDLMNHNPNQDGAFEFDQEKKLFKIKKQLSDFHIETTEIEVEKNDGKKGTVILTMGSKGPYVVRKSEIMAFLLRGMNVFAFNFRGYGLSEGEPSEEGLKYDIEAAYDFVRKRSSQEEKILFKAICLSGGPAAYMARRYPKTNIFLDQTYASFKKMIVGRIEHKIKRRIAKLKNCTSLAQRIQLCCSIAMRYAASFFVSFWTPNFAVAEDLIKNEGKKGIFFVSDDECISLEHLEQNLEALSKANKLEETLLYLSPIGKHGLDWTTLKISRTNFDLRTEKIRKATEVAIASLKERRENLVLTTLLEIKRIQKLLETKSEAASPQQMVQKVDEMTQQLDKDYQWCLQEEKRLQEENEEKIKKFKEEVESETFRETFAGNKMMDHFLSKANLSDDILKMH